MDLSPRAEAGGIPRGPVAGSARWRVRLGQIWIDALRFDEALTAIETLVSAGAGGAVFTPNVDHVVTAEDDVAFRQAYSDASLSLADGQPLVWSSRLLGTPLPAKISGSDLTWPLMERASRAGWRVFLLGAGPGVAERVAARLAGELGVTIAGFDAPFIRLDAPSAETDAIVDRVRAARPDLVLVALGAPKQERWIHQVRNRLRPAVLVGVGASLDFIAGAIPRAPRWMSRLSLEWLYRLVREPRRLAYRYLWKDPRFLAILARTALAPRAGRVRNR
jgi:N-acetylglucosaminyldiphosphoundecaprenol N-acetyl-beta-D-mannosaminyltransferase